MLYQPECNLYVDMMKKLLLSLLMLGFVCLSSWAENNKNSLAGNWMLQEIEDSKGNKTQIEYGANILIFDDILQMACINKLKANKKFAICDLAKYSIYAFDSEKMKLFLSGIVISEGDDYNKRKVYSISLPSDSTLILQYRDEKAIYAKMKQ